ITQAISQKSGVAPFHHNLAGIYRTLGKMDEAKENYKEAIKLKNDYAESYQGLVEVKGYDDPESFVASIEKQLKKTIPDKQKSYFHFSAGRIYDELGNYSKAWKHFEKGNKLAGIKCDLRVYENRVKELLFLYSKDYVTKRQNSRVLDASPVFIVGMPRSGSSLIEQILSSHSDVFGCGELPDIAAIAAKIETDTDPKVPYPIYLPSLSEDILKGYAHSYLKRIRGLTNKHYGSYIDKQLMNFQYIGFILDMFPRSKIIHARRNPIDTCLSCFFQNFSNGVSFSFNLRKLQRFYQIYQRMMDHWQEIYGDRYLTIDYEDACHKQEETTVKLLDHCDLYWQDQVMDFQNTKREVKTASFFQVRQEIYTKSVDRWINYEEQMESFKTLLHT
ncbi:MAG: sulfotransferase, partial [Lentisphaeria bacterium]|nr:sulfotransferase [Lentisphaeria bacterium]NQZ70952.1 sulfotransferase [Lentisphaeria bacterium]